jgi:hypothetical protein
LQEEKRFNERAWDSRCGLNSQPILKPTRRCEPSESALDNGNVVNNKIGHAQKPGENPISNCNLGKTIEMTVMIVRIKLD